MAYFKMAHDILAPQQPTTSIKEPTLRSAGREAEFNVAAHGLRGLASLMVLGAHILGGTARHVYQANQSYVQAIEAPWFLGVFGVKLFFVISGYVIIPSALRYSTTEFARRRFLRIYPLFFVASVAFIILNFLTNEYPGLNNIKTIVSGLLFMNLFTGTEQLTPNAWSLTYEIIFYTLTMWVVYSFIKRPSRVGAGLALSACAAFLLAFPISLFFVAGALIRIYGSRLSIGTAMLRIFELFLFVGAAYLASRALFNYSLSELVQPTALGALICTACYFLLATDVRSLTSLLFNNSFFSYIGAISYSLYLVHPYTYYLTRLLFIKTGLFTENVFYSMLLFSIAVFISSVACSHLAHILLERLPYSWYFQQRVYRRGK